MMELIAPISALAGVAVGFCLGAFMRGKLRALRAELTYEHVAEDRGKVRLVPRAADFAVGIQSATGSRP